MHSLKQDLELISRLQKELKQKSEEATTDNNVIWKLQLENKYMRELIARYEIKHHDGCTVNMDSKNCFCGLNQKLKYLGIEI